MNHLSKNQYIDLMINLVSGKKAELLTKHIKKCPECRKQYNILSQIIEPGFEGKDLLSKALKKRILESAIQVREQKKDSYVKSKFFKLYVLSGAAAAGAIAVFFIVLPFTEFNTSRSFLRISEMYGKAEINAIPARIYDTVSSGNTISTDDDSVMMLRSLSGNYKLVIFSRSLVTLEKANLNNKDVEVKYSLDNGIIYNKHTEDNIPSKYSFATPNALINAENAEMMLEVSNKISRILLIKGKLVVHDPNSSNTVAINSPGRYLISDGIKMTKQEDPATDNPKKIDEALTINENEDEQNPSPENFDTVPVCSSRFSNANMYLINDVQNMLSE